MEDGAGDSVQPVGTGWQSYNYLEDATPPSAEGKGAHRSGGFVLVAPKVKDGEGRRSNNKDRVLPSSVSVFSVPRFLDA